jgi:two-component system, sensor histidine kinase and response regulator
MITESAEKTPRGKILIIDDDEGIRFALESLLTIDGYVFEKAINGTDGLLKVAEFKPDVILLDVMMPGIDGYEVCRRLKADAASRHIPIIMITALDSKEDMANSLNAGADEFLPKPVESIELRSRVRSMMRIKRQYEELEGLIQIREDLTNMVIHDLRSPLMVIMSASESLLEANEKSEDRKWLEKIYVQSRKINNQLDELLLLAKMEHGRLTLDLNEIDLQNLIREAIHEQEDAAESRQIELVDDLAQQECKVVVDPHLLTRVLDNIISNAVKYSNVHTKVTIHSEVFSENGQNWGRIQIIDEGPGVPEKDKERIFQKYEIVDMRQRKSMQIGLGLAFSKMVIDSHSGRIYVRDHEPRGAVFNIELRLI